MKNNRIKRRKMYSRGSTLIMALVTITILMLLGLAVVSITMSTLKSNTADATTNDSFYAAEAGANNAIDLLKLEVDNYYKKMAAAGSSEYTTLYNNFGAKIAQEAQNNFKDPAITGGYSDTTFTLESIDTSKNIFYYLMTTTSTMEDGTEYKVQSRIGVQRLNLKTESWYIEKLGIDTAILAGNAVDVSTIGGVTVYNGNAQVGSLKSRQPWYFGVNNGQTIIDSTTKNLIKDTVNYPSFADPVISNPTYYITANNTNLDASKYPLSYPVKVDTAAGVNLNLTNNNDIPDGIIRAKGNLNISSGGSIACDIYCKDLSITGRAVTGDIYARGNVVITNGTFSGNIHADGNVTVNGASLQGSITSNGSTTIVGATALGSIYSTGAITLSQLIASGNVVYSKSKINLGGSTVDAVLFSGGDVVITSGCTVNGAVVAKNNLYFSTDSWMTVNYNPSEILKKITAVQDTIWGVDTNTVQLTDQIFTGQSITAIGRQK